jgi:hypothetical protein
MAKMVLSDDHKKLVSYIVFSPPKAADERSDEEKDKETRARIEENPNVKDKELVFRLKTEDRVLNEKFFGKGFESRYWEVCYHDYSFLSFRHPTSAVTSPISAESAVRSVPGLYLC